MIHGIFYKTTKFTHQPSILHGSHPALNIARNHQRILTWCHENCWLAQAANHSQRTMIDKLDDLVIVAWARLDNRLELAQVLGIDPNLLKALRDTQLILKAYRHFGESFTSYLFGDFCFAIYNARTKKIVCVRDHMGTKPFYYYDDEHVFVFSSSLALFHLLECIHVRPNMDWACKFLLAETSMDFYKTAYHKIFKLPPSEELTLSSRGLVRHQYHQFHTRKTILPTKEAYLELYQSTLAQAIKNRVDTCDPLASELSGGLDSSAVTAYAAQFYTASREKFFTFSYAVLKDEPLYVGLVNQHYQISQSFISYAHSLAYYPEERALQALGAPVEHRVACEQENFYEIAEKHGIRTLLSGFGGDEFVTAIVDDLSLYELLKNKQFLALYNVLKGNALTRLLRLIRLYFRTDANGGKISPSLQNAMQSRWPDVIVKSTLLARYSLKEAYDRLGVNDHGYHNLDKFTLEQGWVPYVTTRMENCTLLAASYGVDYRWPLLDPRLIQCFLSIPSAEKTYRGVERYLHRRAIEHILPKEIVWQPSKGSMGGSSPSWTWPYPVLNEDLHPDLSALIDIGKLYAQTKNLDLTNLSFSLQKWMNIIKVNQLDNWLKYYFSNGCHWANTPDAIDA